jgi:hypothetical protein
MQPVGDFGFFQEDRNLAAVAGRPGVNVDHVRLLNIFVISSAR